MTKEEFLEKVVKSDGCWEWSGGRNAARGTGRGEYGRLRHGSGRILAHRLSYMLFVGEVPSGMLVLHSCDNPPCVNPEHLRIGTHSDNAIDRVKRGRCNSPVRELHYAHKLTEKDVAEIREAYGRGGVTQGELGEMYGVAHSEIHNVVRMKTWR